MKCCLQYTLLLVLSAGTAFAQGEASRSLPKGEENPQVIEKVYASPFGEVQFLDQGPMGRGAMLRNANGILINFVSVRGPATCEKWLASDKQFALPGGCEFVFRDEEHGTLESVKSEEMEETTLFQATRGLMRQWGRYVTL